MRTGFGEGLKHYAFPLPETNIFEPENGPFEY